MSRRQYGFLIGVLLVWLTWQAGWVVLAAVAVGGIGYGIVRALEGDVDFEGIVDRFRSSGPGR